MGEKDSYHREDDKPAITAFTHSPKCTQALNLYSKTKAFLSTKEKGVREPIARKKNRKKGLYNSVC